MSRQMVNDRRSNNFHELYTFFGCRKIFSLFQSCSFRGEQSNLVSKIFHVISFYALQVSFEQIYYAFAEKPDKLFWARLREKTFAFAGKRLKHLDTKDILCVHRSKTLNASTIRGYKTSRDWIQCLYNNLIDRLLVATSQTIKDSREQKLRLDTSQLALIRAPVTH